MQRVSRCYLVVKCRPSRQFPLGYLHVYFSPTANGKTDSDQRFFCPCSPFRVSLRMHVLKGMSRRSGWVLGVTFPTGVCGFAQSFRA